MSRPNRLLARQYDRFDEAAEWHAKWLQTSSAGLPPEEVAAWTEWVKDTAHKAAYDAVEFAFRARGVLKPPPRPTPEELAADDSDGPASLAVWRIERSEPQDVKRWRRGAIFAAAAAIVAVGFLLVPRWFNFSVERAEPVQVIASEAGQKKHITLPDGSQIMLGSKTELSVHYGKCLRTILLNSGEALFNVAHNRDCPFVVIAGDGAITAVGTQFSVRRTLDHVTVTVADGIVKVQPRDALVSSPLPKDPHARSITWAEARLVKGQEVTYDGSRERSPVESEDPHVATAWLEGRREYRREPLAYVVADINRYFGKQIVLGDAAVGELKFTGRVYESKVMDWLRALETISPVEVSQTESDHILIRSRTPAEPKRSADSPSF